jgi:RsiW-degrading membrane proteinase PrsW (M82 family)
MQTITYLTLLISPLVALSIYYYFRNQRSPEFSQRIWHSWLAGMASAIILIMAAYLSDKIGISELRNLKRTLFFSFITLAGCAETGKFIALRYIMIRRNVRLSPFDTILVSVNVALGFSTVAMIIFMLNIFNIGFHIPITLYSLAFVPANLLFSVVMGFFIGMARYLRIHIVYSLTGLLAAVIFHGIFNFCILTRDYKLLSLFAFGSTVIVFVLALKAAFSEQEDQISE